MTPEKITHFRFQYRFLSNFYPCVIEYEGITYPSVEHAFQAAKTLSKSEREKISHLEKPYQARRAGRSLKLREDWQLRRRKIMYCLLKKKFKDPELRQKLLKTGDAKLIEGNWWGDIYWGVCEGDGENNLGKLLMKIRKEIRND